MKKVIEDERWRLTKDYLEANRRQFWRRQLDRLIFTLFGLPDADALPDRGWEVHYREGRSPAEAIEAELDIDIENPDIDKVMEELF